MQTENTEAVLDHGYLVSCVLPSLPLPSACRGYGLPAGLVRDWKGKKSYAGRALDSLSLLLLPAYERVGKTAAFAEERGAWFPSSLGAPARVAAASLVSMGSVGQVHCTGHLHLLLPLVAMLLGQLGPSWGPVWGSCQSSGCKGLTQLV